MPSRKKDSSGRVVVNSEQEWRELIKRKGLIAILLGWGCQHAGSFKGLRQVNAAKVKCLERFCGTSEPVWMFIAGGYVVNLILGADTPAILDAITAELALEKQAMAGQRNRKTLPFDEMSPAELERQRNRQLFEEAVISAKGREKELKAKAVEKKLMEVLEENMQASTVVVCLPHTFEAANGTWPPFERLQTVLGSDFHIDEQAEVSMGLDVVDEVIKKVFRNSSHARGWKALLVSGPCLVTVFRRELPPPPPPRLSGGSVRKSTVRPSTAASVRSAPSPSVAEQKGEADKNKEEEKPSTEKGGKKRYKRRARACAEKRGSDKEEQQIEKELEETMTEEELRALTVVQRMVRAVYGSLPPEEDGQPLMVHPHSIAGKAVRDEIPGVWTPVQALSVLRAVEMLLPEYAKRMLNTPDVQEEEEEEEVEQEREGSFDAMALVQKQKEEEEAQAEAEAAEEEEEQLVPLREAPPHVAFIFLVKKYRLMKRKIGVCRSAILRMGVFSGHPLPGLLSYMARTPEAYFSLPEDERTGEEKLVLILDTTKKNMYELMDFGPIYISTTPEIGAEDAEKLFPTEGEERLPLWKMRENIPLVGMRPSGIIAAADVLADVADLHRPTLERDLLRLTKPSSTRIAEELVYDAAGLDYHSMAPDDAPVLIERGSRSSFVERTMRPSAMGLAGTEGLDGKKPEGRKPTVVSVLEDIQRAALGEGKKDSIVEDIVEDVSGKKSEEQKDSILENIVEDISGKKSEEQEPASETKETDKGGEETPSKATRRVTVQEEKPEIKAPEEEPKPGEEPKPSEEEPKPSEEQPEPSEEGPKPSEEEPKPSEEEPKPREEEPKPSEEEPKPSEEEPKPSEEEPKPSEEEPKPSEEEQKPSEEEPKPSEVAKPTEEAQPTEETKEEEKEDSAQAVKDLFGLF